MPHMKLSAYLESHGITASAFAETIGRDKSTVTRLSNGDRKPDPATMQAILEATDGAVTPNDFFGISAPVASAPKETTSPQPTPALNASNISQSGLKQPSAASKTSTATATSETPRSAAE